MAIEKPKPLPRPLRHLQAFVNKLARLGPEGHRDHEIDAKPLDTALRKRIAGMDRRSAETAVRADRDLLKTWLKTSGGQGHPAYWVLGYLSSPGLVSSLRRPAPKAKATPKPKQPRRSSIQFEAPDGWTVKAGTWRLDLKAKGIVGLIEGMDASTFDEMMRLVQRVRPVPRPRGAPKMTVTSSTFRRGDCSGKKHVTRWPELGPAKQVQYLLRVPGGGVTIGLDATGKTDFDESPLEAKLHTLRVRRRGR